MIKVENIDVWGFEHAIRGMRAKGYRYKNGRYETFVSANGKSVSLGTYRTEQEAKEAVLKQRIDKFVDGCKAVGLCPYDGREFEQKYILFPSGNILNLHGVEMMGAVDRHGYREVILNGRRRLVHRVIAEAFIDNPQGLEQVNHINGNKTDNRVCNLEWCTRSENLLHAYKIGLEKKLYGEDHSRHKLTDDAVRYIRGNYKKRDKAYGATPLGQLFGVDRSTVLDVVSGKTWRCVQ